MTNRVIKNASLIPKFELVVFKTSQDAIMGFNICKVTLNMYYISFSRSVLNMTLRIMSVKGRSKDYIWGNV